MPEPLTHLQSSLGEVYTIERELGGGGMSRVFLATERALNRKVVIKVLPAELAGALSAERFQREIALAARLQQANIVPVLTAGDAGGVPYFTMPYVEGESLRARLARGGELPVAEAVGILKEVARALAYAHAQHVVHRDIKPDNVLLSGGTAMVTDFGVAKALSVATTDGGASLTATGIALGTPAYMAPEQASGESDVDQRADIYAFGCLAYELLTGGAPFAGRTAQQLIAAHLTAAPDPVERRRPAVPPELASLVARCLEKNPADRPQDAARLIALLDQVALTPSSTASAPRAPRSRGPMLAIAALVVVSGALLMLPLLRSRSAATGPLSVAVIPFENTSKDSTIDYLEDGISDQVRDAVGKLSGVAVKARSSSRRFKGKPAREAGSALGATLVLLGTVAHAGPNIHVTAELVRTADENAVWSTTFDGAAAAMPGIQDSLVRAVSSALRVRPASSGRGTDDPVAWDEFLRGRFEGDRADWAAAAAHFRAAIVRDPRFARAHANLAIALSGVPTTGIGGLDSLNALAEASAARALALDSTIADAWLARSNILANEQRIAESLPPLERAIALDPTTVESRVAYGLGLTQIGRVADGVAAVRRAHELDPQSIMANGVLGYVLTLSGQLDSALALQQRTMVLSPDNILLHQGTALLLALRGQRDSSAAAFRRAYELGPDKFDGRANLVFSLVLSGRMADAARERAALDRDRNSNSPWSRKALADIALGRFDAAMTELDAAVAAREPLFSPISLPCDPRFDPLKANPRFGALMKRMGATACPPLPRWPFAAPR